MSVSRDSSQRLSLGGFDTYNVVRRKQNDFFHDPTGSVGTRANGDELLTHQDGFRMVHIDDSPVGCVEVERRFCCGHDLANRVRFHEANLPKGSGQASMKEAEL